MYAMPEISKLVVVLPCHSLEDFPTHETGDSANSLLASWTALWHPSLIARTKNLPIWVSQDYITEEIPNSLVVAPISCEANLPVEITEAVAQKQAVLVAGKTSRAAILADPAVAPLMRNIEDSSDDIGNDFFALSYAYLQVQLMTRQLRYSTTLDQQLFEERVVTAAKAYVEIGDGGETATCQDRLAACFDMLLEERNNYYPTEANLLNLVLVQAKPSRLAEQLDHEHAFNLLLTGNRLQQVELQNHAALPLLRKKYSSKQVDIVLSAQHELPVQLVAIESLANQIQKSRITATQVLELDAETNSPSTYGSYRFGLNPQLPNILDQFGFELAIHSTLSGGKVPAPSSPVINWQGNDGTNINGLAVTPIDATAPEGFLNLATKIGEMLDSYHHAELLFVHWPNKYSVWLRDLIRIEKYGPLLGRFKTFQQLNETIYDSGFSDTYAAEDYHLPYLDIAFQKQQGDAISRWVRYWSLHYRIRSLKNLATVGSIALVNAKSFEWQQLLGNTAQLQDELEERAAGASGDYDDIELRINQCVEHELKATEILRVDDAQDKRSPLPLLVNPNEHVQSVFLPDSNATVECAPFCLASDLMNTVDRNSPALVAPTKDEQPPVLRNEFFEVHFDAATGGIRKVKRYSNKQNLFSQRLACRTSKSWKERGFKRHKSRYSKMIATDVASTTQKQHQQHWASVTSRGILKTVADEDDDDSSARQIVEFEQTVTLRRGDRRIYFDVKLQSEEPVSGDPWRNYIATRIAWADEDAAVYRSENETPDRVFQEKFVAPNFIEINSKDSKITMLPGGMPFHRRSDRRMLDTLLVVAGEQQKQFKFAIAIDVDSSMAEAVSMQSPIYSMNRITSEQAIAGWVFHLSCKNVVVTSMKPIGSSGKTTGVILRLLETEGRPGKLKLTAPFKIKRARRCKFSGEAAYELPTAGDVATCNFLAAQYFQIEFGW